jgi:hypothetical protein
VAAATGSIPALTIKTGGLPVVGQCEVVPGFTPGFEVFHGTSQVIDGVGLNFGAIWDLSVSDVQHIICSAGPAIEGDRQLQGYFAYQLTFGPALGAGTLDLLISQESKKPPRRIRYLRFPGYGRGSFWQFGRSSFRRWNRLYLEAEQDQGLQEGTSTSFSSGEIKGSYSTIRCRSIVTSGSFDVLFEHP